MKNTIKLLSSFCLVAMVSPLSYASTSSDGISQDMQRQILLDKIKKNQIKGQAISQSPINTARISEQEKRYGGDQYQFEENKLKSNEFDEKMLTEGQVAKHDPFALRRLGKKKLVESNELDKGIQTDQFEENKLKSKEFDEKMPTDEQVANHQKMMQQQEELERNNYKPKKQSALRTPNTSFEDDPEVIGQDRKSEEQMQQKSGPDQSNVKPLADSKSAEEMKQTQEEMKKLLDLKAKMEKQTTKEIETAKSRIKQLEEKTKQQEEYIAQLDKAAEKTKMDLEQAQKDKAQQEQEIKKTQETLAIAERNLKEINGDKK